MISDDVVSVFWFHRPISLQAFSFNFKKKIEKDNKKFEEKMINNKLKVYRAVPQAWPYENYPANKCRNNNTRVSKKIRNLIPNNNKPKPTSR